MNSLWLNTVNNTKRKSIDENDEAEVCIIGAGLTGLSTAYYLLKNGLKVIVVDKAGIGEKASGHTTAKITFQHNLIYDYLIDSFDEEFARGYLEANKNAVKNIEEIIKKEKIDCDFETTSNYVYTENQNEVLKIQKEVDAVNRLTR